MSFEAPVAARSHACAHALARTRIRTSTNHERRFGWNRVVTAAFRSVGGDECVNNMRSGYWATSALSPAAVSAAFNTCTPASLPCHAQQVADLMMSWAGGAAEGSYPPNTNSSSVIDVCDAMQGSGGGVPAYQAALAPLAPGQCLNISWDWQCPTDHRPTKDDENDDSHFSPDPADWGYCLDTAHLASSLTCTDGWSFQACSTEIHPISANNVTDFFPPETVDDRLDDCRFWYGGDLSVDFLAMPRAFGQLDLARMAQSASRIIFSSGSYGDAPPAAASEKARALPGRWRERLRSLALAAPEA